MEMSEIEIKNGSNSARKSSSVKLHVSCLEKESEKIAYFIEKFSFPIFLAIFAIFTAMYVH